MPLTLFGISLLISIALCVHVVRTGQAMYWLAIILMFQPLGGVIYFFAVVVPELGRGPTARRLERAARDTLDPGRAYRQAKAAAEDSPTVGNQMRFAQAAAALGRHEEAETLFREAARGIHAEDPVLLLGRANALLELNRPAEALSVLELLGQEEHRDRNPAAALAMGRAYEALGRYEEADVAFEWAAQRMPGFEALARYAAFKARHGRSDEARDALAEMDKRLAKLSPNFRKEARAWRELAAEAVSKR